MTQEECYEVGFVARTHGLMGEVGVELDVDEPEEYQDMEVVFLEIKNQLVPYPIEYCAFHNDKLLVKFEEVEDVEEAGKLKGSKLYLPLNSLPALEEGQYYYHELISMLVFDKEIGELGKVEQIYSANAHSLIAVLHQGKEVLIPIQDDIVLEVNKEKKEVLVALPDGLLDLYLD